MITPTDRCVFEFGAVTVFVARNIRCIKAIKLYSSHCFSGLYDHRRIWKKNHNHKPEHNEPYKFTTLHSTAINSTNLQYYIVLN
jgi:hypothetical protein